MNYYRPTFAAPPLLLPRAMLTLLLQMNAMVEHSSAVQQWCRDLLAAPLQQTCWCAPVNRRFGYPAPTARRDCCAGEHPIGKWARDAHGNATFLSQHGQDWWLWTNVLARRLGRRGTYVDLATNDPIFRSSTFFLDACLAWQGVCIEANPQHYFHIWQQRSCQLVPACASASRRRVSLMTSSREPSGGMARIGKVAAASSPDSVPCDTLTHMLERSGHRHIDVLSLDVETHEAEVLAGLNFSRVSIDLILIEPTCKSVPSACELLRQAGYQPLRGQSIKDTVWTREPLPGLQRPFECRSHREAGHCRGWDYRGAADYEQQR